jgi:serine/threonine protein kinase
MGTPGYSPPEAIREGRYTPQADVFAWGAVMYELMSGRIPYEGPDTKTTNSYVVQGNAPPPTRHDPSIPEPLSTVAMTALQPSDTKRFKDASEAEAALREAWDRCLTQGLVHPAVLAMDETPHDKAPVRMHEPRGGARPYVPPAHVASFADTNETTAIDDKIPAKAKALKEQQLVVESSKGRRGEDDDPTTLMVREEAAAKLKAKADATTRGVVSSEKTPSPVKIAPPPDTIPEHANSTRDTKSDERLSSPPVVGKGMRERQSQPIPRALLIAIAVLLLVGATAVGLYVGGVVKF